MQRLVYSKASPSRLCPACETPWDSGTVGQAREPWPQIALRLRRQSVVVDEDVEAGVDAVFDKGVEFAGIFYLGEIAHTGVLDQ